MSLVKALARGARALPGYAAGALKGQRLGREDAQENETLQAEAERRAFQQMLMEEQATERRAAATRQAELHPLQKQIAEANLAKATAPPQPAAPPPTPWQQHGFADEASYLAYLKRHGTATRAPSQPTEPKNGPSDDLKFGEVARLRGEFRKDKEERTTVKREFGPMESLATQRTGAGDIGLLYSYIKVQDPNAVREGELALVQKAKNYLDAIGVGAEKLLGSRAFFTDAQRRQLIEASRLKVNQRDADYHRNRAYYGEMARRYKVDPFEVVGPDEEEGQTEQPPPGGKGSFNPLDQIENGAPPPKPPAAATGGRQEFYSKYGVKPKAR